MTNILAVDTTLGACSAAITINSVLLCSNKEIRTRGHVERLLPMIDELLGNKGISIDQMDYIAVTKGPGTFAGVRIGLAAAKGLALALNVPLIGISSLEVLAYDFAQKNKEFAGEVAVLIDARRGEVYMQSFYLELGNCKPIDDPKTSSVEEISAKIPDNVRNVIGSAGSFVDEKKYTIHKEPVYPDAVALAKLAELKKDQAQISDDVEPLYLRAPDAIKPAPFSVVITEDA